MIEFFNAAGRVRDAKIITDRISGRSKGVGYVEFYDEQAVPAALALTGQKLLGIPVIVQLTEAEKNRAALAASQEAARLEAATYRLNITGLNSALKTEDVRLLFEPLGPIENVNLSIDPETGLGSGSASIQYKSADDAKKAAEIMNGIDIAGDKVMQRKHVLDLQPLR